MVNVTSKHFGLTLRLQYGVQNSIKPHKCLHILIAKITQWATTCSSSYLSYYTEFLDHNRGVISAELSGIVYTVVMAVRI